jgi:hypothetical protein
MADKKRFETKVINTLKGEDPGFPEGVARRHRIKQVGTHTVHA